MLKRRHFAQDLIKRVLKRVNFCCRIVLTKKVTQFRSVTNFKLSNQYGQKLIAFREAYSLLLSLPLSPPRLLHVSTSVTPLLLCDLGNSSFQGQVTAIKFREELAVHFNDKQRNACA